MMSYRIVPIFCILCTCLVACFPLINNPDFRETSTPTPITETPTETIEWFPPTATYTPLPTGTFAVVSSPPPSPSHGELIIKDDFSDPLTWKLGEFQDGIIAMDNNELSLAVKKGSGYLSTIRNGTELRDYYAEITVNPSICRDTDEYGIIFRASSSENFYRFSITCDGQARLDRLLHGQPSSPQPLSTHGSIPPGAPSISRIGIWLSGKDMHFFVNGEKIFFVNDPTLTIGGFGVFARAAGEDEITINFSDLAIYEINP